MATILVDGRAMTIDELRSCMENAYPTEIIARYKYVEISFRYMHADMYSMSTVVFPVNSGLPRANASVGIHAPDILQAIIDIAA